MQEGFMKQVRCAHGQNKLQISADKNVDRVGKWCAKFPSTQAL